MKSQLMTFELILSIVREHSGGIKLIELLTEVVSFTRTKVQVDEISDALDTKLKEMQRSGQLGLLDYAYPMGDGQVREKTFVYIPIGSPMGKYYFCVITDREEDYYGHFYIVLKSFWDEHKCLDDRHIAKEVSLPGCFVEVSESIFDCAEEETIGGRERLLRLGLEENNDMRP